MVLSRVSIRSAVLVLSYNLAHSQQMVRSYVLIRSEVLVPSEALIHSIVLVPIAHPDSFALHGSIWTNDSFLPVGAVSLLMIHSGRVALSAIMVRSSFLALSAAIDSLVSSGAVRLRDSFSNAGPL